MVIDRDSFDIVLREYSFGPPRIPTIQHEPVGNNGSSSSSKESWSILAGTYIGEDDDMGSSDFNPMDIDSKHTSFNGTRIDETYQTVLVPTIAEEKKNKVIRENEDHFSRISPSFDEVIMAIVAARSENYGKGNCGDHSCSDPISDPNISDTRIQESVDFSAIKGDSIFDTHVALVSTNSISLFKKKRRKKRILKPVEILSGPTNSFSLNPIKRKRSIRRTLPIQQLLAQLDGLQTERDTSNLNRGFSIYNADPSVWEHKIHNIHGEHSAESDIHRCKNRILSNFRLPT